MFHSTETFRDMCFIWKRRHVRDDLELSSSSLIVIIDIVSSRVRCSSGTQQEWLDPTQSSGYQIQEYNGSLLEPLMDDDIVIIQRVSTGNLNVNFGAIHPALAIGSFDIFCGLCGTLLVDFNAKELDDGFCCRCC